MQKKFQSFRNSHTRFSSINVLCIWVSANKKILIVPFGKLSRTNNWAKPIDAEYKYYMKIEQANVYLKMGYQINRINNVFKTPSAIILITHICYSM